MAAAAGVLDEVVKEYLLYRGFTNTLKAFEVEKKEDKDKGYKVMRQLLQTKYRKWCLLTGLVIPLQVNRIVDYILSCITRSDFVSLQTFWVYLNKRFFSRLSQDSALTVYRLETSILRLFLVQATRQNRQDVVKEFFEKMADALHDKKEWKDWFGEIYKTCFIRDILVYVCCFAIICVSQRMLLMVHSSVTSASFSSALL